MRMPSWVMLNFVCVLQAIKLLDMVYTTPEMINRDSVKKVFTSLSKIIHNLVVSKTKLQTWKKFLTFLDPSLA